jgi:murein DD-endopeptidase MepM/ murein hydrolase activator NlpD
MNIIFVRKNGTTFNINLSRLFVILTFLLLVSFPVVSYYIGLTSHINVPTFSELNNPVHIEPVRNKLNKLIGSVYKDEIVNQQKDLDVLKQHNKENINALTVNLAKLQAHIIRLDSLGQRLVEVADLDKKAFNFDLEPAMGGPNDPDDLIEEVRYKDFMERLEQVTQDIDNKEKELNILENLLIAEHFNLAITPSGKPADKGWISSYFGRRKDPFTGKVRMHKGVDVAGKSGSNVLATADGIVIRVEKKSGYGKLLELDHGYGISTRYGHNKIITVKTGDVVKQGQVIASMGSTGRSTGPHVHYEVLKNGVQVNPHKYIVTAKK